MSMPVGGHLLEHGHLLKQIQYVKFYVYWQLQLYLISIYVIVLFLAFVQGIWWHI